MNKEKNFEISLKKFRKNFHIRVNSRSDFSLLKEIFLHDEYGQNLPSDAKIIFDFGANVGYASIYFSLKYPLAKIYALEPDREMYKKMESNISQFPSIQSSNIGIWSSDTTQTFFSDTNYGTSSSFVKRYKGHTMETYDVKVKRISTFIKEKDISYVDILKFDIEGAEDKMILDKFFYSRIKYFVGEVHCDLMGKTLQEFLKNLQKTFDIKEKKLTKTRHLISGKNKSLFPII